MDGSSKEMIARLVAFDTVSRHSNLPLIDWVRGYLAQHGVESRLVPSPEGDKANLYATIGPSVPGGVVLSAHTDVVPVDGQPWSTDPFTVSERDGRLYGRGTADMKSFPAVTLALLPELLAANLKRPLHLALTYDEEVGCIGAPILIRRLVEELPPVEAVIVGEPTTMEIVVAHKGMNTFRTTVTGHEAHSSQPDKGASAVMTAARLVTAIAAMADENRAAADPTCGFEPPYTTLHVGTIGGGTAINIISRECSFGWDIRTVPGDGTARYLDRVAALAEELLAPLRAVAPGCDVRTELLASAPGLAPEPDGAAAQLCRALTGRNAVATVAYGAEAGQYQEAGYSTVLCGPGSIDQAHQPDEFIEIAQVAACERFVRDLAKRLSA